MRQIIEALLNSLITFLLVFECWLAVLQGTGSLPQGHLHLLLVVCNSSAVGRQEGKVNIRGKLENVLDILPAVRVARLHSGQVFELLDPGPAGRVLAPDQSVKKENLRWERVFFVIDYLKHSRIWIRG